MLIGLSPIVSSELRIILFLLIPVGCKWNLHVMNLVCIDIKTLNAKLNPICHLLALLGAGHILHVSRIRVKGLGPNNSLNIPDM